ncbi:MAG: hypothetical protein IBJ04_19385 [Hydrogenophaga sp.]|uniref:DUF2783 domain-containing protein n=1 Tax=Hydrogenophaga crocea TaxID=2716225 RepID=A0A6G8IG06_9BURK|nr:MULTISPECIES: hypothetical protein [Hydrogenophaga]MBL0946482.1 hypothetical protein [Hydrogenophaga sp.]QIM51900.1 hypothetical protein G9Q37_06980 [Hydrogenophaga crocea]
MTDTDLDTSYTALCKALGDVGEPQAPLMLAMLSLSLLARLPDAAAALPLIEQARVRCLQEPLA